MTATGTSRPASLIEPSTLDGVAPSASARREASWITGPSMTGSEKGIPSSIASARPPPARDASTRGLLDPRPVHDGVREGDPPLDRIGPRLLQPSQQVRVHAG